MASASSSTRASGTTRTSTCPAGTSGRVRSRTTSPRPASRRARSTLCCVRTCTSTTSLEYAAPEREVGAHLQDRAVPPPSPPLRESAPRCPPPLPASKEVRGAHGPLASPDQRRLADVLHHRE